MRVPTNSTWALALLAFISTASGAHAQIVETTLILKPARALHELAQEVSDSRSIRYEKPFSPDEVRSRSKAREQDYAKLVLALKKTGFAIVRETKGHHYLTISGDHEKTERFFSTKFTFRPDGGYTNGGVGAAPAEFPIVDRIVSVKAPHLFRPHHVAPIASPGPIDDSDPNHLPGLHADAYRAYYGLDRIYQAGFTGKGQNVATVAFGKVDRANPEHFFKTLGTANTLQLKLMEPSPINGEGAQTENELDIEEIGKIAPDATITAFVGNDDGSGDEWAKIFEAILDDGSIRSVNLSYGIDCGEVNEVNNPAISAFMALMDPLFARAVAQGVTIVVATGDDGADDCGNDTKAVNWPSGPGVLTVGGTTLQVDPKNPQSVLKETAWAKSGGGVSIKYSRPEWQAGFDSSIKMRGLPDLAMLADPNPGQAVYTVPHTSPQPQWFVEGGTSIASPAIVGFIALVNEARAKDKPLPFLAPLLYSASADHLPALFHDITEGGNGFDAKPGWDAATGWGSPRADALFDHLVGVGPQ